MLTSEQAKQGWGQGDSIPLQNIRCLTTPDIFVFMQYQLPCTPYPQLPDAAHHLQLHLYR